MTESPPAVRHFETLQFGSLFVGVVHQFALSDGDVIPALAGAAIVLWLTLSVSRRRKNWARWLLVIAFLIGLAMTPWLSLLAPGRGYPFVTLAVWLAQAAAIALLFTPQASDWLRPRAVPSPVE
jgi:uncharacterized membrane protein YeiB